jgi:hypothetical protein
VTATFENGDDDYLEWKQRHPTGFILNCERPPRAAYLMLHSVSCQSLRSLSPGYTSWTTQYAKVCAESRREIDEWIAAWVRGGRAKPCELCNPDK